MVYNVSIDEESERMVTVVDSLFNRKIINDYENTLATEDSKFKHTDDINLRKWAKSNA